MLKVFLRYHLVFLLSTRSRNKEMFRRTPRMLWWNFFGYAGHVIIGEKYTMRFPSNKNLNERRSALYNNIHIASAIGKSEHKISPDCWVYKNIFKLVYNKQKPMLLKLWEEFEGKICSSMEEIFFNISLPAIFLRAFLRT